MSSRSRLTQLLAVLVLALGLTTPALAAPISTITFQLTTGNTALTTAGFLGPYADVTVDLFDATHATITFSADGSYRIGDGGSLAVNVNATSFTSSSPATTNGPAATTFAGAGQEDGFGNFNDTYDTFDGAGDTFTLGHFDLINGSGTWATASDVLTANKNGALAAAHIFAGCTPTPSSFSCVATGFAAGNGGGPPPLLTPEPASLLLLGTGLAGLAFVGRRRGSRRQ